MNRAILASIAALMLPASAIAAPDNADPQTPLCVTAARQRLCRTVVRFTVKKLDPGDAPILNLLIHKDGGIGQTIASVARGAQDIIQDIVVDWVDRQHEHLLNVIDSGNVIRALKYTHGEDQALEFFAYPAADAGHYGRVWRAIPSGGSWIYNYLYFATVNGVQTPQWTSDPNYGQLFTHVAADTAALLGQTAFNEKVSGINPSLYIYPTGHFNYGTYQQTCYLLENTTVNTGLTWQVWVDPTYTPDGTLSRGGWYFGFGREFQDCGSATMLAGVGNDAAAYAASGISGAVYGATKQ